MKAAQIERVIKILETEIAGNDYQIERLENAENLSESGEAKLDSLTEQRDTMQEALDLLEGALSA